LQNEGTAVFLLGAMVVHKCELGVFLTRTAPTKPMLDKAMTVGYKVIPSYKFSRWLNFPKPLNYQIVSIFAQI